MKESSYPLTHLHLMTMLLTAASLSTRLKTLVFAIIDLIITLWFAGVYNILLTHSYENYT